MFIVNMGCSKLASTMSGSALVEEDEVEVLTGARTTCSCASTGFRRSQHYAQDARQRQPWH